MGQDKTEGREVLSRSLQLISFLLLGSYSWDFHDQRKEAVGCSASVHPPVSLCTATCGAEPVPAAGE